MNKFTFGDDFLLKHEYKFILLGLIWIFYSLFSLLDTSFISDDAYNSQIRGALIQQGIGLFDRILSEIKGWFFGAGRVLVLGWVITYSLYYLTINPIVVKLITILIILAGVLLFYFFVKKQSKSLPLSLLVLFLMPIFFQFRLWHDPILAFTFLLPICFLLLMASIVLFQSHLNKTKNHQHFLSILFYFLSAISYEVTLPLSCLYFILAFDKTKKFIESLKLSYPYLLISFSIILIEFAIKFYLKADKLIQSTYPGSDFYLEPMKFLSAFCIQIVSTAPLSYFISVIGQIKFYKLIYIFSDFFVFPILFMILYILFKKFFSYKKSFNFQASIFVGILLLVLPAFLSSISGHQIELNQAGYGMGYLTVYIQYFGFCLLLLLLLAQLKKYVSNKYLSAGSVFMAIIFSVMAILNLGLNRVVANKTNKTYKYPRVLIQKSLEAGLLNDLDSKSLLLSSVRVPSDYTWFYSTILNRSIKHCDLQANGLFDSCLKNVDHFLNDKISFKSGAGIKIIDLSSSKVWSLSYSIDENGTDGRVLLAKLDKLVISKITGNILEMQTNQIKEFTLNNAGFKVINFNNPIDFYKIISNEQNDIKDAIQLKNKNFISNSDILWEWIGTYNKEGSEINNLRWTSRSAKLYLYNRSKSSIRARLRMGFASPDGSPSKVKVDFLKKSEIVKINGNPVYFEKTFNLPPGEFVLGLNCDGKVLVSGDPRIIVFGIFNFSVNVI
jgi:hypothetical protein